MLYALCINYDTCFMKNIFYGVYFSGIADTVESIYLTWKHEPQGIPLLWIVDIFTTI